MATAADRGWGSGYPYCQGDKIVRLYVDGVDYPGGIRREIRELVTLLLKATKRRGYKPKAGWCWGYACRAIRGSTAPSNHSWGLAVDINAPKNPMGGGTDMPDWMPRLWEEYGFRWGGTFSRPDAMHYEFMGTPRDAAGYTKKAREELVEMTPKQLEKLKRADHFLNGIEAFVAGRKPVLATKPKAFRQGFKFARAAYKRPKPPADSTS